MFHPPMANQVVLSCVSASGTTKCMRTSNKAAVELPPIVLAVVPHQIFHVSKANALTYTTRLKTTISFDVTLSMTTCSC